MAAKHLAVSTWLEALGLLEYLPLFQGYAGVEDLLHLGEREIRDLGVKNPPHRVKIVSSLAILKEKYQKSRGASPGSTPLYGHLPPPSPSGGVDSPSVQALPVSPERLKADLERELAADPSELRSRAWYHGNISRQRAEVLVSRDGDFLVRDCISKPGDFVLTCCWRGVALHFMVNALVGPCLAGELPSIAYQFEEGSFSSIQELIQYYMSQGKAVTAASNAVLTSPIPRSMPLSYYDAKYGALFSLTATGHYSPALSPKVTPVGTPSESPSSSPRMIRRMQKRTGSQPLLSLDDDVSVDRSRSPSLDRCDSMPVISGPPPSSQRSPGVEVGGQGAQVTKPNFHQRSGSEPVMMPTVYSPSKMAAPHVAPKLKQGGSDSDLSKPPPPKPSRIPSVKYTGAKRPHVVIRNIELYEDDDRDYSDYMQVKEPPSWTNKSREDESDPTTPRAVDPRGTTVTMGGDVYDNNFNNLKKVPSGFCTGVPQIQLTPPSSEHKPGTKLSRTRLTSDTRFSVLDPKANLNESSRSGRENAIDADSVEEAKLDNARFSQTEKVVRKPRQVKVPAVLKGMTFCVADFSTTLLSGECKPLEAGIMVAVKSLLLDHTPLSLARHLTKIDLDALKVTCDDDIDLGVFVQSGLELLTLPQGKQLRQDIIERSHCCKLLVQVTILTCSTVLERAAMLSHWLDTAAVLKQTMGNLFAFFSVMEAVSSPQVQRLRDTWMILRQKHTTSAYLFDSKLKAAFRSLGDGTSNLPLQGTSIPNVTPVAALLERDLDDLDTMLSWERVDANLGLESMLVHLDMARLAAAQWAAFRHTALELLEDFKPEEKVLDAFRTEFHLQLLWGSKGAGVNRADRHRKFEQLVTILSNRAEPPGDDGTAV